MAAIPTDLLDRIRALERQVRALMASANTRPALNQISDGQVTISDTGTMSVRSPDGTGLAHIGALPPGHADGSPQQAFVLRREDGTTALALWTDQSDEPQAVRVWDARDQLFFAEDLKGGGLALPYLPVPMGPAYQGGWESWPRSESNEYEELWTGRIYRQQPKITLLVRAAMDTEGATGEVRLRLDDRLMGEAQEVGHRVGWFTLGPFELPPEQLAEVDVVVVGRRTEGQGSIRATVQGAWTHQSSASPELPASPAFEARGSGRSPDKGPAHSASPTTSASPAIEARGLGGSAPDEDPTIPASPAIEARGSGRSPDKGPAAGKPPTGRPPEDALPEGPLLFVPAPDPARPPDVPA